MAVTRLRLSAFRCYERAAIDCDERPVVLTGPNGSGKTSLLEAVSYLAPGRGLRGAVAGEIDRRGGVAPWAVAATIAGPAGTVDIGTGRDPGAAAASGTGRRVVRIDGAPGRGPAALGDHVSIVWLTPQMDRLFLDGAGGRRRFLDRFVYAFDPEHARRVNAYDHAMRERARLLKTGRADAGWLGALEETMAERGVAIAAARIALAQRLDAAAAAGSGPFPGARVAVAGEVEDWLADGPALAAEERLMVTLRAARRGDGDSGRTAHGPHRSDLEVSHARSGMPAALCSTGEQKALMLAIVLAHAGLVADDRGAAPILLLDEVAAHLDAARRHALLDALVALGAQAWLTGTDRSLFAPLGSDAQYLAVDDAAVFSDSRMAKYTQ